MERLLTSVGGVFVLDVLVRVNVRRPVGVAVLVLVLDMLVRMRVFLAGVLVLVLVLVTMNDLIFHSVIIVYK